MQRLLQRQRESGRQRDHRVTQSEERRWARGGGERAELQGGVGKGGGLNPSSCLVALQVYAVFVWGGVKGDPHPDLMNPLADF